jgi:hypothetical protein
MASVALHFHFDINLGIEVRKRTALRAALRAAKLSALVKTENKA